MIKGHQKDRHTYVGYGCADCISLTFFTAQQLCIEAQIIILKPTNGVVRVGAFTSNSIPLVYSVSSIQHHLNMISYLPAC